MENILGEHEGVVVELRQTQNIDGSQTILGVKVNGFENTHPQEVCVMGKCYEVATWSDLKEAVYDHLAQQGHEIKLKGRKGVLPSPEGMQRARQLSNKLYIEVNYSANSIVEQCLEAMLAAGIDPAKAFQIRLLGEDAMKTGDDSQPQDNIGAIINELDDLDHRFMEAIDEIGYRVPQLQQQKDFAAARAVLDDQAFLCTCQQRISDLRKDICSRFPRQQTPDDNKYVLPILQALAERGGSAPARDVIKRVGELLAVKLAPEELELVASGQEMVWENRTRWTRNEMAHVRGLLEDDSPRGTWEITAKGEAYLKTSRT